MSDRKFNITITAFDKATAILRRVNRSLSDANRPINQLGRSMKDFTKETGFTLLGRELVSTARAAGRVANEIGRIIAPLGVVVGAGSISAVGLFASGWANAARNIEMTSLYTGESADKIRDWVGAGKLLGVTADQTGAAFVNFGQKMEDALYGRDNEALAFFNSINLNIGQTGRKVRDTGEVIDDFADRVKAMQKINPSAAFRMIRFAGLESLAPMLYRGHQGMKELRDMQAELGFHRSKEQIQEASDFQVKIWRAKTAVDALRDSIGQKLIPVFSPLIDKFTAFVGGAKNMDRISEGIATTFKPIVDYLVNADWNKAAQGVADFLHWVGRVVHFVGGWKNAMIGLAVIMNARTIVSCIELVKHLGGLTRALVKVGWSAGVLAFNGLRKLAVMMWGFAAEVIPVVTAALEGMFVGLSAVLEATPIGWFLTAVAAVGFLAYEVWEHWDWFEHKFGEMWDWVVRKAKWAYDELKKYGAEAMMLIPGVGPTVIAAKYVAGKLQSNGTPAPTAANYAAQGSAHQSVDDIVINHLLAWKADLLGTKPASTDTTPAAAPMMSPYTPTAGGATVPTDAANQSQAVDLTVTFANAPKGLSVATTGNPMTRIDLRTQHAMPPVGP